MKVTVSRQEISDSAVLLERLKTWESLVSMAGEYSRGEVNLKMQSPAANSAVVAVKLDVDRYHLRPSTNDSLVRRCDDGISKILGDALEAAAKKIVDHIKASMPLPVA